MQLCEATYKSNKATSQDHLDLGFRPIFSTDLRYFLGTGTCCCIQGKQTAALPYSPTASLCAFKHDQRLVPVV